MIGAGAPCTCPACLPCTCHPHLPGDSVLQTCRWATHCMGAPSQPEGAAGQTRISLISPPQDGHVGSISYRGPQNLSLTPNQSMAKPLRVPPLQMPYRGRSQTPAHQCPGVAGKGASPILGSSQAALPSQAPATRPLLSISGLLQRQHLS
ncbi:probable E3 SUMO-protein ligase RNF212 isoform X2 [Nycticebus coucang]|uniref:probable E3 SUMO-protein ligase RNF212 isoform X2 n=1 Tax=Nycticebus coucang TaxID=9470 RepID=UPI00234DF510|nr:probable E3 SUMO-protein ligase RNF212 isoform X2 [Nycticebus coucang]XP_053430704.1 probable E3 SUMO-protein ligase RNF212 isoform X2 [Nycticebus coucang]XP_053430705.1 probable E3 SUMO-protein ligase RNF212 isoform X2 [Nycticebus coucang]